MAGSEKPRHRSGYGDEEFQQVKAACLTIAVTLGAYLDDVCVVGGLVPSLLIDSVRPGDYDDERHPGTSDLDVGLALALLDDERYMEISKRLRAEGFEPDTNDAGNPTVQRWRLKGLKITVDFLMPPALEQDQHLRVQPLEGDFGALVTPGLQLAFDEVVHVELAGRTFRGEEATRSIPVCGPAAFVVLKSLAFGDRGEPKDAFDLVYVIRYTPEGARAIAERLAAHADTDSPVVTRALEFLARDFRSPAHIGPMRAAEFTTIDADDREEFDNLAADAHGFVEDLLREAAARGLTATPEAEPSDRAT